MINNWPEHYYELIYSATKEWRRNPPELRGSCIDVQMLEIAKECSDQIELRNRTVAYKTMEDFMRRKSPESRNQS